MILLKAWQLKQTNGLDWFNLDEVVLDNFLPDWKECLTNLIEIGLIEVNPYNDKLNFKNNETSYRELHLKSSSRILLLKEILVSIDKQRYSNLFEYSNQKHYAKNRLK
ncbi:hypothetical protein E1J38_002305 [Seonamhaeicola sediminis]|uniref:Uncharacterized protein n=1 Tax=Seonamhaeicola sediminis TaxID=2528206 RepID=A0A562YJ09_9FLAO|nr:hypothetical protein [Seonamhaeicola sediminis]TWO34711.1 hypothetical protein E1J38_002305 [Seonamhaeicola sediminis]